MTSEQTNAVAAEPESLWTIDDCARFLRTSRSWCYQASARGELPSLHLGRLLRFDGETIRRWAQGKATPSGGAP